MSFIARVTIVVDEYDPAIAFFVDVLGFELVEDSASVTTDGREKRWVEVRPPGAETGVLLARADGDEQKAVVGQQLAGRVGSLRAVRPGRGVPGHRGQSLGPPRRLMASWSGLGAGTDRRPVASDLRMRRTVIVLLLAGVLAACSSSPHSASPSPATPPAATSAPRFDVVLDDHGLTFPPGKTLAAKYRISFEDRRTSPPAGQKLHLQFIVGGPQLLLFDVPAGTSSTHTLLANMTPEVVSLDPGFAAPDGSLLRPEAMAHRHSIGDVAVTNPLEIEPTPEFPTPVT